MKETSNTKYLSEKERRKIIEDMFERHDVKLFLKMMDLRDKMIK